VYTAWSTLLHPPQKLISYKIFFVTTCCRFATTENDIDVYPSPWIKNLRLLWDEGVEIFGTYDELLRHAADLPQRKVK